MNDVKFCINCRFYTLEAGEDPEFGKCAHPTVSIRRHNYYVTGEGKPFEVTYCTAARIRPCGTDATLFEPKEETSA